MISKYQFKHIFCRLISEYIDKHWNEEYEIVQNPQIIDVLSDYRIKDSDSDNLNYNSVLNSLKCTPVQQEIDFENNPKKIKRIFGRRNRDVALHIIKDMCVSFNSKVINPLGFNPESCSVYGNSIVFFADEKGDMKLYNGGGKGQAKRICKTGSKLFCEKLHIPHKVDYMHDMVKISEDTYELVK